MKFGAEAGDAVVGQMAAVFVEVVKGYCFWERQDSGRILGDQLQVCWFDQGALDVRWGGIWMVGDLREPAQL